MNQPSFDALPPVQPADNQSATDTTTSGQPIDPAATSGNPPAWLVGGGMVDPSQAANSPPAPIGSPAAELPPVNGPVSDLPPVSTPAAGLSSASGQPLQQLAPAHPLAGPPVNPPAAMPLPPAQPPAAADYNPIAEATPAIADDVDLIEKEWVEKAKQIVEQTKQDPYQQNEALKYVKADYLKKRYNRDLYSGGAGQ